MRSEPELYRRRGSNWPVRYRRVLIMAAVAAVAVACAVGTSGMLRGATAPTVVVNPPLVAQWYTQPTPIHITVDAANLSGWGLTPVSGYQYGLAWNPSVLQWVSGPDVGPGTPTPAPVLPCLRTIVVVATPTATPTGFVATWTPTFTATLGPLTPTYTPTQTPVLPTATPTATATPDGYIEVACATLTNATPVPNGTLGSFTFLPVASAQASTGLSLVNVKEVDFYGNPVTPGPLTASGVVRLMACNDVNGDGVVNLIDMVLVGRTFGAVVGNTRYVASYDVNNDGAINTVDMALVGLEFGKFCTR